MTKSLTVKGDVFIEASATEVWKTLTWSRYIRQWDHLPEDYGYASIQEGSVLDWAGYSKLTVTQYIDEQELFLSLYGAKWEKPESAYKIGYHYALTPEENGTRLTITIGDFSDLPDGDAYYEASEEFLEAALEDIKKIAESI